MNTTLGLQRTSVMLQYPVRTLVRHVRQTLNGSLNGGRAMSDNISETLLVTYRTVHVRQTLTDRSVEVALCPTTLQ